jgi:hypothetical protein
VLGSCYKDNTIQSTLKCFDIQSIIKNYEGYVISLKLGRTLPLTQRVGGLQSPKLQASSPKLLKHQAASIKPQVASVKLEATSNKLLDS